MLNARPQFLKKEAKIIAQVLSQYQNFLRVG
jgi:hypothetical protein